MLMYPSRDDPNALRHGCRCQENAEPDRLARYDGDCSGQRQLPMLARRANILRAALTFSIHQKAEMDRSVKEEIQSALWITAKTPGRISRSTSAILDVRKMFYLH